MEAIRQGDIPGVQLRCRQLVVGSQPTDLWPWLTEPPKLERWLCDEATVDLSADGGLDLRTDDLRELGQTLELEPPCRWVMTFRAAGWRAATKLTLELVPRTEGTEVAVLQRGFEALPLSDCLTIWERYRRRWSDALGALAVAGAGR